jgi:hypothetical protein
MSRIESHGKGSDICCLPHVIFAGFLLGLVFDPKDGGDMFLRKVG